MLHQSILEPDSFLREALFDVAWRKKQIVKAKIDFDFTQSEGDRKDLERHFRELVKEENRLQVLTDKFANYQAPIDPPYVVEALKA